jgi:hypothetical protein
VNAVLVKLAASIQDGEFDVEMKTEQPVRTVIGLSLLSFYYLFVCLPACLSVCLSVSNLVCFVA